MLLNYCKNCNRAYQGKFQGKMALLCRPCAMDCEDAYIKIHRFLKDQPADSRFKITDKDKIAEETGIPAIFVLILIREGRFDNFEGFSSPKKEVCKSCQQDLKPTEHKICKRCSRKLSNQASSALNRMSLNAPPPAEEPSEQGGSTGRTTKYGLGRSHTG